MELPPRGAHERDTSLEAAALVEEIRERFGDARVVLVTGDFNIVHPGHLRLLNFAAECGDVLVVGVYHENIGSPLLPLELRLEGVRAISVVNHAFVLHSAPDEFIRQLRPAVVVKGKEHETRYNPELAAVESYGGELVFSSGDVRFSSLDLLQRELRESVHSAITKPSDFPSRHGFTSADLVRIVERFHTVKMTVIGDLIVDDYITCDPVGMSQEDPTLVVTPIKNDLFVGGAGIVAAHAKGLGADVTYLGVVGRDDPARFAERTLSKYGVDALLIEDRTRPTTLKQRFRATGKTLLRVSHLRQHDVSHEIADQIFERATAALDGAQLLVFSDFSYGCLPQELVERLIMHASSRGIMMVADSQASSQVGDVTRFQRMNLITPTEREARLSLRDFSSGLVVIAEQLRQKAGAERIMITLGAEGLLVHAPRAEKASAQTDRLPAFNLAPKDVSGAGDSLLTCSAMAHCVGASIWESAYLGSVAAACQVARVGNSPLTATEMITELRQ